MGSSQSGPLKGFAFGLLLATLSFGCAAFRNLNILTAQDEQTLGEEFDREITAQAEVVNDPLILRYVEELTQRLVAVCKRRDIPYHVRVLASEEVNAFAVPGGYLYVNLGLLRAAKNESELAGVLAHEIGHVVARHGAKQLTKQYGIEILVRMATGSDPTLTEQIVGTVLQVGATGLLLKYSREDESEADRLAVQNVYDAGIDPNGLATFFETLLREGDGKPSRIETMLSTHPPTPQRIRSVRAQIAQLPSRKDLSPDNPAFQKVRAALPPPKETR